MAASTLTCVPLGKLALTGGTKGMFSMAKAGAAANKGKLSAKATTKRLRNRMLPQSKLPDRLFAWLVTLAQPH